MVDDTQGRPAGDTPGTTPETPAAPSGTPAKLAGKYESVDALERGYLEAQGKLSEMGDRLSRMESLVLSGGTPAASEAVWPGAAPPVGAVHPPAYDDATGAEFVSRAEAARLAEERVNAAIQTFQRQQAQQQSMSAEQQYWRDEFFRKHPDLKDDEMVVRGVMADILPRYQHLDPARFRAFIPSILDEAASKARERIAGYITRGRTEAERRAQEHAQGQIPGSEGTVTPPALPPKEPTPEEIQAEMEARARASYARARATPSR